MPVSPRAAGRRGRRPAAKRSLPVFRCFFLVFERHPGKKRARDRLPGERESAEKAPKESSKEGRNPAVPA
ncbi:MAG: hypothetical protein C6W57_08730 [Caldibacillus debilis]|nr:MAG: hypothetical protein BAA03_05325 [Caldibacillus debilis]REJ16569.1 MAG: hypothetical protein C6W57_08730 [Caldibacillus debilis]REJ30590.1 MAG: hypothetical protein C6W56_02920 [Caldibacillus debilis]